MAMAMKLTMATAWAHLRPMDRFFGGGITMMGSGRKKKKKNRDKKGVPRQHESR